MKYAIFTFGALTLIGWIQGESTDEPCKNQSAPRCPTNSEPRCMQVMYTGDSDQPTGNYTEWKCVICYVDTEGTKCYWLFPVGTYEGRGEIPLEDKEHKVEGEKTEATSVPEQQNPSKPMNISGMGQPQGTNIIQQLPVPQGQPPVGSWNPASQMKLPSGYLNPTSQYQTPLQQNYGYYQWPYSAYGQSMSPPKNINVPQTGQYRQTQYPWPIQYYKYT